MAKDGTDIAELASDTTDASPEQGLCCKGGGGSHPVILRGAGRRLLRTIRAELG
jgi:hypothetical protein